MNEIVMYTKPNDHVTNYLDFKDTTRGQRYTYEWEETATLLSGSVVHRNMNKRGLSFQLFLNKEEYHKIKEKFYDTRLHFYGGYYIYHPPSTHLIIEISKFMKWNNNNPKTRWLDNFNWD